MRKKLILLSFALLVTVLLIGCSSESENDESSGTANDSANPAAGETTEGGTLNMAYAGDPNTIDWMSTSAIPTRDVAWHIFETLFTLDKDYQVKPMIAEDYEVSEDEKEYTITIREGVNFHDGSTVTAEDVVASINRWTTISPDGQIAGEYMESVEAVDELTVTITLNEVYTALLTDLATPRAALIIIPAEIAEEAGEQPLQDEQLIGTGPFQFEKWSQGDEITLTKFDDYSPREEEDWGGLAGKKVAYVDELIFHIVGDPQVMVNGMRTGIYDYAQTIPQDLYEVIENEPTIDPVTYINGYSTLTPDKSEAPFDDINVRQALNHALDKDEIAASAYGNEDFYNLDGALFDPVQTTLYTEEGTGEYLAYDPEKAEELLAESDYDGEPITIMYANNNESYKRIAQIAQQQMEEVGFTVELDPYEWATYLERWQDPANWDLVVISWGAMRFSPSQLGMLVPDTNSSGWYNSEQWENLLDEWTVAGSEEERKEILAEMNQTVNDELPFIKIANEIKLDIKRDSIPEYDNWFGPRFWNTSKSE